jgi:hypothetical protein
MAAEISKGFVRFPAQLKPNVYDGKAEMMLSIAAGEWGGDCMPPDSATSYTSYSPTLAPACFSPLLIDDISRFSR